MKPKQLFTLLLLLTISSISFAQNENAFASIGKKGKVLTLTKGQYNETFDADSIQQIGSSLINIHTMRVVNLLTDEESKKRLEGEKHSRFLSVDPLARSFPWNSPYSYAEGDVIRSIDLDGLEKYIVVNSYDKYGRTTKIRVESIVTVGSNTAIDQDFKIRGSKADLTDKIIYTQHLRGGQFIASDGARNGGLTPNEALAYNTTITSNNRSNSFDTDNGIQNGGDGELGNEFLTQKDKSAYSLIKGSVEGTTHNYKDGERRFTNTNASQGSGLINGVNYIKGTLSSAEGTGTTGGRLDIDYASKYIKGEIVRQGKDFMSKGGLNVGFVESITITYANKNVLNDWQKVAQNLGGQYGVKVNLVFDSNIEMKEMNAGGAGSKGYGSVSVGYSGVSNGNNTMAEQKGQIK
jgi:hypothetical protein